MPEIPVMIDRHARRMVWCDDARIQAKALAAGQNDAVADPGYIEGYAAVWDAIDKQGEVFRRGAFKRSISQVVPAGKAKLMVRHYKQGGDVDEMIGTLVEAREDDYGLWVKAQFTPDTLAQGIRAKAATGHIKNFSVGFYSYDFGTEKVNGKTVLAHRECGLAEVTVTNRPQQELAVITGAKAEAGSSLSDTGTVRPDGTAAQAAPAVTPSGPTAATLRARVKLYKARMAGL